MTVDVGRCRPDMQAAEAIGLRFQVDEFDILAKKPVQVVSGSANIAWLPYHYMTGLLGKHI